MGVDKSQLQIQGETLGCRLARQLGAVTERVTVIGQAPIQGYEFVKDAEAYRGPLVALSQFKPMAQCVFVASCDIVLFDSRIVRVLQDQLERHPSVMAVVPWLSHKLQPLCAIYRNNAFGFISTVHAEGRDSMMAWLDSLWIERFEEDEIRNSHMDPECFLGADTPEAFQRLQGKIAD